jgi:hypothetical protein
MPDYQDKEPGDTPGRFINRIGEGVRADLEKSFTDQILEARREMREEQDRAEAEWICSNESLRTQRMAEYRRGTLFELGGLAASAATGFASGFLAQRQADLRPMGVPAMAIVGLPGLVVGTMLDEGVATRAYFVVGGTMFSVGATTYALLNPRPKDGEP